MGFMLLCAKYKVREEKELFSGFGVRQTNGEKWNSGCQAVVCARQREITGKVGFRLRCTQDNGREQKEWVSGCGVRQTNGQIRNSWFQAVVCARQT